MRSARPQWYGLLLFLVAIGASRADAVDLAADRNRMVDEHVAGAGIKDPRVIQSLRDTPRHEFMLLPSRSKAYYDMAVPIGEGQTISPPFVVAYMTEQLLPKPTDIVLEIGTGSGYQAAVLSPLVKEVYTIEIVKPLGERAARTLKRLKYTNVHARVGDGYQGWPEHAPFDKIIVTCSPEQVPPKLIEQLREGGRMIVPVGKRYEQTLYLFQKQDGELKRLALLPTLFVPMTGKAEDGRIEKPDPAHPQINNGGFETLAEITPDSTALASDGSQPKSVSEPNETEKKSPTATSADTPGDAASDLVPVGWHYQTQMKLAEGTDSPQGAHYVTFTNQEADRGAHALQGIAVDGRKVSELKVTAWVKAKNLRPGATPDQLPLIAFTFYDEDRKQIAFSWVGPWRDSFDWTLAQGSVPVPPKAREAILRIGLNGATGEMSFDDLRIEATPKGQRRRRAD